MSTKQYCGIRIYLEEALPAVNHSSEEVGYSPWKLQSSVGFVALDKHGFPQNDIQGLLESSVIQVNEFRTWKSMFDIATLYMYTYMYPTQFSGAYF